MEPRAGSFSPGTVFEGKYRVERLLGRGGMGEVYAATHLLLNKPVAVKVLLPELADDVRMAERMTREARAASATGHPHIALVTDMGWTGERPFLVMELLAGETLHERISRGPIPVEQALTWMDQLLDALQVVHEQRLVHRDLKPGNLMLVPGRDGRLGIKILDFGITKSLAEEDGAAGRTGTGEILGTPRAMAPEQARAVADLDGRADVHAAGAVLYTMLCGQPPFAGPTVTAVLTRLLEGRYEPVSTRNPGVPPMVDAVIARALAVDREQRYPDAISMRKALAEVRRGLDDGTAFASVGPPAIEIDADLPRDRTLPTPAAPPVPWPTSTWVTEVAGRQRVGGREDPPPRLELDVPARWRPGHASPPPLEQAPRSIAWGWWLMVVALVAAGIGAWLNWDTLTGTAGELAGARDDAGERVLILVDTTPKNAIVFVDGVQNDDRPLQIPRSEQPIELRVVAQGYTPRMMQLVPARTRRVKIALERER